MKKKLVDFQIIPSGVMKEGIFKRYFSFLSYYYIFIVYNPRKVMSLKWRNTIKMMSRSQTVRYLEISLSPCELLPARFFIIFEISVHNNFFKGFIFWIKQNLFLIIWTESEIQWSTSPGIPELMWNIEKR